MRFSIAKTVHKEIQRNTNNGLTFRQFIGFERHQRTGRIG